MARKSPYGQPRDTRTQPDAAGYTSGWRCQQCTYDESGMHGDAFRQSPSRDRFCTEHKTPLVYWVRGPGGQE